MIKKLFCICFFCISQVCIADRSEPYNLCNSPYKPYKFANESELAQFKLNVKRYQDCIEDFVREQERAIDNHRRAANRAIEEWNSFVNRLKY